MADDLYFIPILARALRQPATRSALRDAFIEIERLGRRPGYELGLAQFHDFMEQVRDAHQRIDRLNRLDEQERAIEAAFRTTPGDVGERGLQLERIPSAEARALYEEVCAEIDDLEAAAMALFIRLESHGREVGTVTLSDDNLTACFCNVVPGDYELLLDTGRVLWEGTLTAADCIWTEAFPGEPFALAADTGHVRRRTSREVPLLGGELTLRVLPGIEAARLELTWQRPPGSRLQE